MGIQARARHVEHRIDTVDSPIFPLDRLIHRPKCIDLSLLRKRNRASRSWNKAKFVPPSRLSRTPQAISLGSTASCCWPYMGSNLEVRPGGSVISIELDKYQA